MHILTNEVWSFLVAAMCDLQRINNIDVLTLSSLACLFFFDTIPNEHFFINMK